jgi:ABC-type Zn uptake system ZnuABC Zn-binding protein ZnuA
MSNTRLFTFLISLAAAGLLFSACGQFRAPAGDETASQQPSEEESGELAPVSLGADEKLQVIATTNIVADVVSEVGGDTVELTQLLPLGADPHTYVPTPRDLTAVAGAHAVFANGAELEADFLPQLIQDTRTPVIYLSRGIDYREFGEDEGDAEPHESEGEGGHEHEEVDPHTWTSPINAIVFVRNAQAALSALDPAHAEAYQANADVYAATLQEMDEWVQAQINTIPTENRELVTDHATFGYYADRYGLEQVGAVIPGFITGAEPSARHLAELEDKIQSYAVPAIFVGTTVNPSLAQQVADDTDIQLVTLYTGSLGPPGSGAETYVDYLCYNTLAIVRGLGGRPDVTRSPCKTGF